MRITRLLVAVSWVLVVGVFPVESTTESLSNIGHSSKISAHDTYTTNTFVSVSDNDRTAPKSTSRDSEEAVNDMPNEEFCMDMEGMRMVMFVKGFRRSLSSNQMLPCLSYYVRSWVLNDEGKFKGAMVYSFLLGLVTQGLAVIRAVVFVHVRKGKLRKYLMVAIYVLQVYMGYMIMLVAMMYSVELLLSAVVGLSFGYFIFHKGGAPQTAARSGMSVPLLTTENRSTTNA